MRFLTLGFATALSVVFSGGSASADHFETLHEEAYEYHLQVETLQAEIHNHRRLVTPLADDAIDSLAAAASALHDATEDSVNLHRVEAIYHQVARLHWQVDRDLGRNGYRVHPLASRLWSPLPARLHRVSDALQLTLNEAMYEASAGRDPLRAQDRRVGQRADAGTPRYTPQGDLVPGWQVQRPAYDPRIQPARPEVAPERGQPVRSRSQLLGELIERLGR